MTTEQLESEIAELRQAVILLAAEACEARLFCVPTIRAAHWQMLMENTNRNKIASDAIAKEMED